MCTTLLYFKGSQNKCTLLYNVLKIPGSPKYSYYDWVAQMPSGNQVPLDHPLEHCFGFGQLRSLQSLHRVCQGLILTPSFMQINIISMVVGLTWNSFFVLFQLSPHIQLQKTTMTNLIWKLWLNMGLGTQPMSRVPITTLIQCVASQSLHSNLD